MKQPNYTIQVHIVAVWCTCLTLLQNVVMRGATFISQSICIYMYIMNAIVSCI